MTLAAAKQPRAGQSVRDLIKRSHVCLEQRNFQGAERSATEVLALDPRNVEAFNVLGIVHAASGRLDEAVANFRTAAGIDPEYPGLQGNLVAILGMVAERDKDATPLLGELQQLIQSANAPNRDEVSNFVLADQARLIGHRLYTLQRRECIDALRLALKFGNRQVLDRIDLNNFLSRFDERAQLADYTQDLRADQLGKNILIACFPKSGSTLLKKVLCEATGFGDGHFVGAYQQNEQEICLPNVLDCARSDLVIQQHCRATEPNLHLLQAFGVRPIILVRNIFDVLLSFKEFCDVGAYSNTFFPNYRLLSEEQRCALMVDDRAPWYVNFFAGWQRAVAGGRIDGFWLTYKDFIADPRTAIEEILKFQGIAVDPGRLARAAGLVGRNEGDTRFNKGVAGRGSTAFSPAQVEQIQRLASYHPDVDFSLIGL